MTLGLCFWVLMLVWLAFVMWVQWPNRPGPEVLLFVLLLLLGWAVFGPPIRG